jgi:hypothetical protein
MQTLRSIKELNWALTIYTDIVKFGDRSQLIQESEDCVKVLEDFEEYEKCFDIHQVLTKQKPPAYPQKKK